MPGISNQFLRRAATILERNHTSPAHTVVRFQGQVPLRIRPKANAVRLDPSRSISTQSSGSDPDQNKKLTSNSTTSSKPSTTLDTTSSRTNETMFAKAVKKEQASQGSQPSRAPSSKTALAKTLFPSSSPNPVPARAGTVLNQLNRKPPPLSSSDGRSQFGGSTTTTSRLPHYSRPSVGNNVTGKGLASLCNSKADSFTEVIDLLDDTPPRTTKPLPVTESFEDLFDENDFSDDDHLDLDFPCALPTQPRPQPEAATVTQLPPNPPPASDTSLLSWSQSSPSHYAPLHRAAQSVRAPPPKRQSPRYDEPISQPPKKVKRELPWPKKAQYVPELDDDVQELYEAAAATPVKKPKSDVLWNTTASAVKEQKKQLKTQQKGPAKGETSVQEMLQAMTSHTKTNKGKAAAIALSEEQRHVKSLVVEKGQSVFFTGPAGTGKSVLMRSIIQDMKKKYARDPERLAVTASTGLAACNIGGITLHSFAGIGLGKEDASILVKKIRRNPKAKNRWLKTKTLIIDEISMVDGDLFDKLSQVGRIIRNNGRPWGGIQLVITGDFFQLPPVPDHGSREHKFAFDAATWDMSIDHTIGLTEVFRQKDPEFAEMLNEMRLGRISDKTIQNFNALSRPLQFNDGLQVTELFPTRNEVENSNRRRLEELPGKSYTYTATDSGEPQIRDKLLANMMAPPTIELKKGAQVMLIKNMDETLVNGSLGTVEGFMTESTFELTSDDPGAAEIDSDTKKRIRMFTNALEQGSKGDNTKYPLVRFRSVDGTSRKLLCVPEDWKVELPTGEVQASRKQLPLILAWALSIHKAQGQTLERVKVDLGKVFEKGQAYVALSRATTQQGLQVLRFRKDKVMAHPRVITFYNNLYSAELALKKKATGPIGSFAYKQAPPAAAASSARRQQNVADDDEEAMMAAFG